MRDWTKEGYEKVEENVWRNKQDGFYYTEFDGTLWLINEMTHQEANVAGVKTGDWEQYRAENEKLMGKRKREGTQKGTPRPLTDYMSSQQPPRRPQPQPRPQRDPLPMPPEEPEPVDWAGTTELAPASITQDIVRPVVSVERVKAAFDQLQEIKRLILTKDDYAEISGRTFVRKSGLRKLRVCFNISQRLLREERKDLGDGHYEYTASVRAQAPNGVFVDAVSSCASNEPFGERQKENTKKLFPKDQRETREVKPEMYVFSIRAMAQTRAYNRAISDLVGGGIDVMEEEERGAE